MRHTLIEVKQISKKIKEVYIFKDFSAYFEVGKIYGIIGEEKSEKSMLLKCIVGKVPVSEGEIYRDHITVGFALEEGGFIEDWSAYKNIKYLVDINRKINTNEIEQLLNWIGIKHSDKRPLREYPLEMKKKLILVQALIEKPSILVLDHFFADLDKKMIKEMYLLLNQLCNQGMAILISDTHKESLIELCDSLIKIEKGQVNIHEMVYRNLYHYI